MLDKSQITAYRRDGYLVVKDLFNEEWCDDLLANLEAKAEKPDYPAIMNGDRDRAPEIWEAMKDPRVIEILDTLQDYEVVALMSQVLFKKAGSAYASQAWNPHQDNSYPQAPYGAYITTNIFLENADPRNGGMYIFPGSHVEPLLPCIETPSYREIPGTNPGNTVEVPPGYEQVDLWIPKGGMLVLHGHVIHGSYPNDSPMRSRPLLSASYVPRWAQLGRDYLEGRNAKRRPMEVRTDSKPRFGAF